MPRVHSWEGDDKREIVWSRAGLDRLQQSCSTFYIDIVPGITLYSKSHLQFAQVLHLRKVLPHIIPSVGLIVLIRFWIVDIRDEGKALCPRGVDEVKSGETSDRLLENDEG